MCFLLRRLNRIELEEVFFLWWVVAGEVGEVKVVDARWDLELRGKNQKVGTGTYKVYQKTLV